MGKYVIAAISLLSASPANAADKCSLLAQGSFPPTQQLSALIALAKKAHVVKGEFESTSTYETRLAAAAGAVGLSSTTVVEWPLSSFNFEYNADTQEVAISNPGSECPVVLPKADTKAVTVGKLARSMGKPFCIRQVVSSTTGTPYIASNAFGVAREIFPEKGKGEGVFLGHGSYAYDLWHGERNLRGVPKLFRFSLRSDLARSLKENGTFIIQVSPKPPFYTSDTEYIISPTVSNPRQLTVESEYLVGDIQCIAIADRQLRHVYAVREVPAVGEKQRR